MAGRVRRGRKIADVVDLNDRDLTEPPAELETALVRLRQEVAHRRRAEEVNSKFAAIVEHSNDAIIGLKLDGTIVTWNRAAELIFGYTTDEACGRDIAFLSGAGPPSDESARVLRSIRRGELVPSFQTRRVRRDGTVLDVALTASPICDADGRVVGASLIIRDITRRAQAERALRESEAKARAILDTAVDAIITIDARGIIESFNRAAERLFRCTPADIIGRSVNVLMPAAQARQHDRHIGNYLETGRAKVIGIGREVVAKRFDGTTFPAELAVSEVRLGDDRRMFTGIVRDVSERKRLERQILEISDREKRRISQDLHDSLGQLLTGIGFRCKSLENKLAARELPEAATARQIAQVVAQAVEDARGLARGLQPVEARPNGLTTALEDFAERLTSIFGVACTFTSDPPVELSDAPAANNLYRIAQEAAHNAVKHGHAKKIDIRLTRDAEAVRLTVKDDGVGFDAAAASNSAGLGLQIMRYRAAMIGGTLTIARRGNGSGGTVVTCETARLT
jgi:PAS domain S-box-containing protein